MTMDKKTANARFVLCIVFPLQKVWLLHLTAPAGFCSGQDQNGLSCNRRAWPGTWVIRQIPETGERVNEKSADDEVSAQKVMGRL